MGNSHSTSQKFSLLLRVRPAPVVGDSKAEGRPQEELQRDAELELRFALCEGGRDECAYAYGA